MDLVKLNKGEALLVKRLRGGMTQVEMSKLLDVSCDTYRAWERGTLEHGVPRVQLGRVAVHEACRILRRRAKKSQRTIAEQIGVSRLWVTQMERGLVPIRHLADFWGLR
jgi:transcriptional regulator with XRE-family HTH domain